MKERKIWRQRIKKGGTFWRKAENEPKGEKKKTKRKTRNQESKKEEEGETEWEKEQVKMKINLRKGRKIWRKVGNILGIEKEFAEERERNKAKKTFLRRGAE